MYGNFLAYLMLLVWPLASFFFYRRLSPDRALLATILGGYLLLPPLARIDLPAVPDLDKFSIPSLTALFMALFVLRDRVPLLPPGIIGKVLMVVFVLGAFATVLTNPEPVYLAVGMLPAMRLYDSVAAVPNQIITLLPLLLGRRYLATPEAMRNVALALVLAGLVYSLPMLVEVRLSPQINVWVYGFFQHDFLQMMRAGGFRPIVFLPHGLWVAFFALMCYLSALALLRDSDAAQKPKRVALVLYLALMLVLCKSAGPMIYALGLTPVLMFCRKRTMFLLAAGLAVLAIAYPVLRGMGLVPVDGLVAFVESWNPARAQSLGFRFDNEEVLLERAAEKILFGWGGYGRNLLYDPYTGRPLTISDGMWIIAMGLSGWVGFLALFGLLALPLFALAREALRRRAEELSLFAGLIALMLAANMVDLIPNATVIPFTWLMAGALLGYVEHLATRRSAEPAAETPQDAPLPAPRTVL